jgi:hypothetical protein
VTPEEADERFPFSRHYPAQRVIVVGDTRPEPDPPAPVRANVWQVMTGVGVALLLAVNGHPLLGVVVAAVGLLVVLWGRHRAPRRWWRAWWRARRQPRRYRHLDEAA